MKRYLSYITKIAKKKNNSVTNAMIKRVMWNSFEQRLKEEFYLLNNNDFINNSFGNIYLDKYIDTQIDKTKIMYYNILNTVAIRCGNQFLPCYTYTLDENGNAKFSTTKEGGAVIWYAQTYDGRVLTFISPYKNDFTNANESEFLIRIYNHPQKITKKEIRKNFKLFFKYALSTSAGNISHLSLYLFRIKLLVIDLNFRSQEKVNSYLYKSFIIFFTFVAAIAGLLALK